jgi:hypothetical protein
VAARMCHCAADGAIAHHDWRRRSALMLASQLPDNPADALVILDLVRELVVSFLQGGAPEPAKAPVITLIRS